MNDFDSGNAEHGPEVGIELRAAQTVKKRFGDILKREWSTGNSETKWNMARAFLVIVIGIIMLPFPFLPGIPVILFALTLLPKTLGDYIKSWFPFLEKIPFLGNKKAPA